MASVLGKVVSRAISTTRVASGQAAVSGHQDGWKLWRKLTFLVALPGVALCMLNVYLGLDDAEAHSAPPFVPYEYMRIRNKRFPWGDGQKSLFHNPHVNALPSGYEHTDEHH
ncbi:hypothetical protein GHT06_010970 [Daphnia sinensis]|uniref:Cytochrome c oxidase subunit n=1 Tax=Daphnia sinensis TaxID=1820382 RepID=A0AAD5PXX5_9CRUS|nr:hypothetical protein GHT06_010970 [Daphnia sinensis]